MGRLAELPDKGAAVVRTQARAVAEASALSAKDRSELEQQRKADRWLKTERFKGRLPTPPALPAIIGINLPKAQSTETADDLTPTPTLRTNSENLVSQSH